MSATFDAQIAAVMQNPLLTPEQRQAMIAALRQQQRNAAENARQWVLSEERAVAKTRAVWRRNPRRHHR